MNKYTKEFTTYRDDQKITFHVSAICAIHNDNIGFDPSENACSVILNKYSFYTKEPYEEVYGWFIETRELWDNRHAGDLS